MTTWPKGSDESSPADLALDRRNVLLSGASLLALSAVSQAAAQTPPSPPGEKMGPAAPPNLATPAAKPNILVIFGDDVGIANISAYSNGLMGYETPNIDRIAREGIKFQHYYGEQSCTAGRAAFLTGQHGIRTGLTKVGFPGAPMGMSQLDPSIGGLLKNLGYATGQFGKNHVGDRNPSLPTVNGFDEFFGNLYHLNAEEEPELPDYPKDPAYLAKFGPRGVLRCKATDVDDPTEDPRFGKVGKQTIEDTGALTKKRMETIDDETSAAAIAFMQRQQAAGKPFFCWFNSTRMHLRTHVRDSHRGRYKHGDSEYVDGMLEHEDTIGGILKALDDMGVADNTVVVYTSDNGPHMNTWPDGAMTWFRSEKNTNWEGAFRVPCLVRWPGKVKPGTVTNEIASHNDWGSDALLHRWRAGHRGQAQGRLHCQWHQLQGSPGRLRPVAVLDIREWQRGEQQRREKRARQVFLLRRRRPARRYAARRLQIRLLGAAGARHDASVGGAVHHAAPAENLQPVPRPVRAGGHHVQHVLGLAAQSRPEHVRHHGRGL
jgi:arylsulfatase A-like enzyme